MDIWDYQSDYVKTQAEKYKDCGMEWAIAETLYSVLMRLNISHPEVCKQICESLKK
jgi:hypothetical protein